MLMPKRAAKAVSPILAVLMLLAITFGGSVFVYTVVKGSLDVISRNTQIVVKDASLIAGGDVTLFELTLGNSGSTSIGEVTFSLAEIPYSNENSFGGGALPLNILTVPLYPAHTTKFSFAFTHSTTPPSSYFQAGKAYTLLISAQSPNGDSYTTVVSVDVLPAY